MPGIPSSLNGLEAFSDRMLSLFPLPAQNLGPYSLVWWAHIFLSSTHCVPALLNFISGTLSFLYLFSHVLCLADSSSRASLILVTLHPFPSLGLMPFLELPGMSHATYYVHGIAIASLAVYFILSGVS